MNKFLQQLLRPFAALYGGIMQQRNRLYEQGVLRSEQFDLPVIAVGNLTVGGTGKTPHVEYLLRLLQNYKPATLSRGYKRKTKGFVLADAQATAATIGDEPFQYYSDFKEVVVAVSEDRVAGIQKLRELRPETEVIILDDAMQHRPVSPSLNILLTDYGRLFFKDFVLPAGLLREPRKGAARADVVVVTKCPDKLTKAEQAQIRARIQKYTRPETPIFFSYFTYGKPLTLGTTQPFSQHVLLLTGIANPAPLQEYLQGNGFRVLQHLQFPDHHAYTRQDLEKLQQVYEQHRSSSPCIMTTRKDAVKLADPALADLILQLPLFYLPIEVNFREDGSAFDEQVLQHVAFRR